MKPKKLLRSRSFTILTTDVKVARSCAACVFLFLLPIPLRLQVRDDGVDLSAELGLAGHDLLDAGVELLDVDLLGRVFLLHPRGDGEVVVVLSAQLLDGDEFGEVLLLGALLHEGVDLLYVLGHELVLVTHVLEEGRGIHEEDLVVCLALGEHDDAGGDGDAKEEV